MDSIDVDLDAENRVDSAELTPIYHTYNAVQLFYDNGGGNCYIVSIGDYDTEIDDSGAAKGRFINGLTALRKFDEPTLLLFPDAIYSLYIKINIKNHAVPLCFDANFFKFIQIIHSLA